jgi:NlpE N-terminal domain
MLARTRFPHFWLALGWLLAAACSPISAAAVESDLSGIYQGRAPAADAAQRVFTLNLAADGSAMLTTLFIGKDKVSERGRWVRSGGQIVLTFDPMGANRPPRPITFRRRGHKLSPISWDHSEWGSAGPPVLYRSHAQAGP